MAKEQAAAEDLSAFPREDARRLRRGLLVHVGIKDVADAMLLAEKNGRFSLTAFWFSTTMAVSLLLVAAVVVRLLVRPEPELVSGLAGIAAVLGLPNAILAGTYTWGKKIDRQS